MVVFVACVPAIEQRMLRVAGARSSAARQQERNGCGRRTRARATIARLRASKQASLHTYRPTRWRT
eukprot:10918105-Alexandrium_andersonii.AAC.1